MDGRAPDDGDAGRRFKAPVDDAGPFPAGRRRRIVCTMPERPEIVTCLRRLGERIVHERRETNHLAARRGPGGEP